MKSNFISVFLDLIFFCKFRKLSKAWNSMWCLNIIFDLYHISCTYVKPMNCMVLGNKQYNYDFKKPATYRIFIKRQIS